MRNGRRCHVTQGSSGVGRLGKSAGPPRRACSCHTSGSVCNRRPTQPQRSVPIAAFLLPQAVALTVAMDSSLLLQLAWWAPSSSRGPALRRAAPRCRAAAAAAAMPPPVRCAADWRAMCLSLRHCFGMHEVQRVLTPTINLWAAAPSPSCANGCCPTLPEPAHYWRPPPELVLALFVTGSTGWLGLIYRRCCGPD